MRSKLYSFPAILGVVLMMQSCANDAEPVDGEEPVVAQVSATIGLQSRASGTSWDDGDMIGISGRTGNTDYINVPYITTDGGDNFVADKEKIYFQNSLEATFNAYYPYAESGGVVDANTEKQDPESQKTFDFLWTEGATASVVKPVLSFKGDHAFNHRMTRLVLNIKADTDTGVSTEDIASGMFYIDGIRHDGSFNTETGEAYATGSPVNDWIISATPLADDNVYSYSLIFFPQQDAGFTFKAKVGGQEYSATLTPAFAPGVCYSYNITIKNTGLKISACSIRDWVTEGTKYDDTEVSLTFGDKPMKFVSTGDFYFSDGSFADKNMVLTEDQANACIGIVFFVGPHEKDNSDYTESGIKQEKCHGYVVALTDVGGLAWSTEDFNATGVSTSETDWNGYANQKKLVERGIGNYPAAKGCENYGTGSGSRFAAPTGSSGWFLPSAGQLKHLYDNKDNISGQMDKCRDKSGDNNIGWFSTDWYYWSSSEDERYSGYAWSVRFRNGDVYYYNKRGALDVRAVLAF